MKTARFLILLIALSMAPLSMAQLSFNTGDATLEAELNLLNDDAKKDLSTFKSNMATTLDVTKEKIQSLLDKAMEPAEIILSGRIADISGNSLDDVVKSYEANKDKGWGYIAKEMGIKPGSPEFHALKGKGKSGNKGGNGNSGNKGKGKK